ncbi:hypothetical protein OHA77_16005 [Streptosporangium sp. NBC_01639]|uniref:hypothetical protein n=1 Tax=Streptosporangium sp. NBC_01639 TaxID=2975948 RepID=UPI003864384B|nr:hypothetical protein OHA77_16005 [Streptosporangium sp. NBC_01639]
MVRWRSGLVKPVAVSMLGLLGWALIVLPSGPAGASSAELEVDYRCTGEVGGIARNGPVDLRTKVTIPTTLTVGEPLNIGWKLGYQQGASRFGSPDYFAPGGKVKVTGNVQLSGGWVGTLKPIGAVDQPGQLQPGTPLKLPEGISDFAHTDQAGTVKVTPQKLFVDFTPPAGEVMVNDDDPRVSYHAAADWEDLNDQPQNNNDHHYDIHRTDKVNSWASFTFTGTGIEYIAQRDQGSGKVGFKIDGQVATPAYIDASKNSNGTPTNDAHKGGLTLWKFHGLNYGSHTIEVMNLEDAKWAQLDAFRVVTRELANPPKDYRATCTLVSAPVSVNVVISDGSNGTHPPASTCTPTPSSTPSPSPTCVQPTDPSPTPTCTPTPAPTPSPSPTCVQPTNPSPTPTCTPTPAPTPSPSPTCVQPTNPSPTPTCTSTLTPTPMPTPTPTPTPTCKTPVPPSQTPSPTPTVTVTRSGQGSTSTPKPTLTVTATVTPTRATPTTPQVVVTPSGGAQTGEAPDESGPSGMTLIGAGSAMVLGSGFGGVALLRRRAAHARRG